MAPAAQEIACNAQPLGLHWLYLVLQHLAFKNHHSSREGVNSLRDFHPIKILIDHQFPAILRLPVLFIKVTYDGELPPVVILKSVKVPSVESAFRV